jgi:hypothetical protein
MLKSSKSKLEKLEKMGDAHWSTLETFQGWDAPPINSCYRKSKLARLVRIGHNPVLQPSHTFI